MFHFLLHFFYFILHFLDFAITIHYSYMRVEAFIMSVLMTSRAIFKGLGCLLGHLSSKQFAIKQTLSGCS